MVKKITKDKAIHSKDTISLYWQQTRKFQVTFIISLISIPLGAVLLDTLTPYFLSQAVGTLGNGGAGTLSTFLTASIMAAAAGVILNVIGYQTAIRHDARVRIALMHDSLQRLLAKDQGFFANERIGALTGKFIDFVGGCSDLKDLITVRITIFVINVLLGVALIAQQSILLALLVLGFIVALLIQVRISRHLRMNLRNQRKKLIAEVNGLTADIIANYSTVKTFSAEDHELRTMDTLSEQYRKVHVKDFTWMSIEAPMRILLMQGIQIFSVFLVAGLLAAHKIELGIAVFIIAYLQRLAAQLFTLGEILFGYDKLMLQAAPMTEILLEPPVITDTSNKQLAATGGRVEFTNVTYAYKDDKQARVLDGFNLVIPAGQKIGLVGQSGAGKTTLTRLLLRFDDLDSGTVMIDGQDIASVTQHSLRMNISYVPQEPMLFHRSLRDNIAYGNPAASDEQIMRAIIQANAHEFINKLPRGLDTIVGERGIKLSGGQRQRVAIARALLKDAPILILDEATSALDSESEAMIQQSLNTLMTGRTSIVVAHRLSTLRHMDRIIVMSDGKVTEDGTHAELLAQSGIYAKLWHRQSGGFIEE